MDLDQYVEKVRACLLSGHDLAKMVEDGLLSKTERRKIAKLAQKEELTERQKLRLAVKEKKALPKITKEDRKRKFGKDLDSEREHDEANFTICLGCRKRGHFVKDCPKLAMIPNTAPVEAPEVCFNCGSPDHTLKSCTKARESRSSLKFANCFICKQQGHIARDCPENPNGLYPNGGCCHICLQKTHLVRDCPERTEEDKQMALLRKQKAEDDEKGVRVKGLTADSDNTRGGDDIIMDDEDRGDSGDDEKPMKKAKKSKSGEKPKKKKQDK